MGLVNLSPNLAVAAATRIIATVRTGKQGKHKGQYMDRSKYFVTALHADRDYMSILHWFYRHRMHGRQTNNVTMEDTVGNTFACYVEVVGNQPFLFTEADRIRTLYLIPNGALIEMRYVGRSRFMFRIPMSEAAEPPVEDEGPAPLVEDEGPDLGPVVAEGHDAAVSYIDEEYEFAGSDDDGEVVDS